MYAPNYDYWGTGAICFRLPGYPFVVKSGPMSAMTGKVFIARVFEEMYELGYDFVTCSDLSRTRDQGNLFFKKAPGNPRRRRNAILCVAPGGTDKIFLTSCPDDVNRAITIAIGQAWPNGIQSEYINRIQTSLTTTTTWKLNETPWKRVWGAESVDCRILIMSIMEHLEKINWRFHAIANIEGELDALFFMNDPESAISGKLSMLSLNRANRLRLINFSNNPGIVEAVTQSLKKTNGHRPTVKNYHGSTEFKVSGKPFCSTGYESIACREMITGLLEVLRQNGYEVLTGIDVSSKANDKSSILFRKCVKSTNRHACISLNSANKVRIINFPTEVSFLLSHVINQHYLPGIIKHESRWQIKRKSSKTPCHQIKLEGSPWNSDAISNSIHAKSMLTMLLKEAHKLNWELVASLDLSGKYVTQGFDPTKSVKKKSVDVHAWFFRKSKRFCD
jgi:hypothetical protein